jgi:hypothetical protein
MPRRLGRILECFRVIELYEADGKRPTTRDVAAVVYRVRRNFEGQPVISEGSARFYKGSAIRASEQATCSRQASYRRYQERAANIRATGTRRLWSRTLLFLVNGSQ